MGAAPGRRAGRGVGLPLAAADVGAVRVGSRELRFGQPPDPAAPDPQLVFLRHTDAGGWQVFEAPQSTRTATPTAGRFPTPSRRGSPARAAASSSAATPAARPASRWSCSTTTPAAPGASCSDPPPPACCCRPKANCRPRRWPANRAPARSRSRPSTKAGAHRALLRPARAARSPTAIVHFDGQAWSREPIDLPAGSETHLPHPARSTRPASATPGRSPKPTTRRWAARSSCSSGPRPPKARSGWSGRWRGRRSPTRDYPG